MANQRLRYLFYQFIHKKATPEEVDEFQSIIRLEAVDDEVKTLLDEYWNAPAPTLLSEETADRIFNKIISSDRSERHAEPTPVYRMPWRIVAAIVIFVGLVALFYMPWSHQPIEQSALAPQSPVKPDVRLINLPDGSTVVLNKNSKLKIDAHFNKNGTREVYLTGEAYFNVTHHPDQPFIVYTGKLQTTVLGTAFNINQHNGTVTVTVSRGKVKVADDEHMLNILDPNEQVVFDQADALHTKKVVDAKAVIAWKNSDIFFDNANVQGVAMELEERFGVSIAFSSDAVKNCRFTATFLKDQTLEQILKVIEEFHHLRYEFTGKDTILLTGSGCPFTEAK